MTVKNCPECGSSNIQVGGVTGVEVFVKCHSCRAYSEVREDVE